MPLLAVIASGNTIPSTDSYNVQQLEKRGDNDPASKKSAAKNPMAKLMEKYEAQKRVQSQVSGRYLGAAEQLKGLNEQEAQVRAQVKDEMDRYKKKKLMTTSSSSEELPTLKHTVAEDGKGKPKELNNALKKNRGKQYKLAKDVLKAREKFNQKHLEKQDEITSGEASNKKLPETQAQAAVKPSSMPRVRMVNTNPISSPLKMPRDYSHGTKTEPKQVNDDQQRASDDIRERYQFLYAFLVTSIANRVVECEQVTGHRIQSGLVPAIQKSRLRLLGCALDPSVENVYTWLRGGVLNGEADLDQRWLDGTVEHESMGTRHDNRALVARLADFLQVAYRQYQSTLWQYYRDRLVEVG
ncbi:hypothetical protein BASA61_003291 [Batrachochytrium salamandrivorans]|nr:hypothetical protein BASA62_007783 [Batrachochytrium salamandrivorans]KAH6596949.1 hypothetical protein BASA61_003291 [Batrachochytrium salamandrivorans]